MRRTLGDDIEGACGQLRNKELQGEKIVDKSNPSVKPKPNKNTLRKVKDVSELLKNKQKKDAYKKKDSKTNNKNLNSKKFMK